MAFPQNGAKVFAMRHRKRIDRLGRPADQRKALVRGLVTEVLRHGRITTTKVCSCQSLFLHGPVCSSANVLDLLLDCMSGRSWGCATVGFSKYLSVWILADEGKGDQEVCGQDDPAGKGWLPSCSETGAPLLSTMFQP